MASTALVLQHGPLGPPGVLGTWLSARGIAAEVHPMWEARPRPDPSAFGLVASLGSEHSVTQASPAWIGEELDLLRRAVAAGTPVLGLCFGGQALARVLGGVVAAIPEPQIGWLPVDTRAAGRIPAGPWLHFHFESFSVPPGAAELARNAAGPAAFVQGPHLGVQFHPEVTPEIAAAWARVVPGRLEAAGTTPDGLRAAGVRHGEAAARQAHALFDAWWTGVGA